VRGIEMMTNSTLSKPTGMTSMLGKHNMQQRSAIRPVMCATTMLVIIAVSHLTIIKSTFAADERVKDAFTQAGIKAQTTKVISAYSRHLAAAKEPMDDRSVISAHTKLLTVPEHLFEIFGQAISQTSTKKDTHPIKALAKIAHKVAHIKQMLGEQSAQDLANEQVQQLFMVTDADMQRIMDDGFNFLKSDHAFDPNQPMSLSDVKIIFQGEDAEPEIVNPKISKVVNGVVTDNFNAADILNQMAKRLERYQDTESTAPTHIQFEIKLEFNEDASKLSSLPKIEDLTLSYDILAESWSAFAGSNDSEKIHLDLGIVKHHDDITLSDKDTDTMMSDATARLLETLTALSSDNQDAVLAFIERHFDYQRDDEYSVTSGSSD